MTSTIKTLPASKLVLDFSIYPRHGGMDASNLRDIAEAMEAGVEMPPVVADRRSLRLTDGFHRTTVALRRDPDATMQVELRDYADDGEMLLDAARLNLHGQRLSPYDRARVITLAGEFACRPGDIAAALSMTLDGVREVESSRTAHDVTGRAVIIKRSLSHLAGTALTPEQVACNESSSGWSFFFHARQLDLLLRTPGAVNWEDTRNVSAFNQLIETLAQSDQPA
jgi:hypothetical protein